MELKDTVAGMQSADYKERFVAEYEQLAIRFGKLSVMCQKWDVGELDFTPTCPRELYTEHLDHMQGYLDTLAKRAEIEGVELPENVHIDVYADAGK